MPKSSSAPEIKEIPQTSGVYFFFSKDSQVLYIGKAKNLRKRVSSYFYKNAEKSRRRRIQKLIEMFDHISWEEHPSEQHAIRRERELIRAFVPRFNRMDAWLESYLFLGLAHSKEAGGTLKFSLGESAKELEDEGFSVHGCFSQRKLTKLAQGALLRLLFASHNTNPRFSFPSKLTKPSTLWSFEMKIENPAFWYKQISDFYHGKNHALLGKLFEKLLANPTIPEYTRLGIQRDINLLKDFHESLKTSVIERTGQKITQRELRKALRESVTEISSSI